jgi:hypothetical protein
MIGRKKLFDISQAQVFILNISDYWPPLKIGTDRLFDNFGLSYKARFELDNRQPDNNGYSRED